MTATPERSGAFPQADLVGPPAQPERCPNTYDLTLIDGGISRCILDEGHDVAHTDGNGTWALTSTVTGPSQGG